MHHSRAIRLPQSELNREKPSGTDLWILIPTLSLVALGVAMVFSASMPLTAVQGGENLFEYLQREVMCVVLGLTALVITSRVPMEWYRKKAGILLSVTALLLVAVYLFGCQVNGARSWFAIPGIGFRFQPSEMAKIVLVIAAARYFTHFPRGLSHGKQALQPMLMLFGIAGLVAIEPDMGSAAVIMASMLVYYHIAGARFRHLLAAVGAAMVPAALMIMHHPYQIRRIIDFFLGKEVELAGGYQKARSLIALGSGGLFGRGYCGSIEKYFYLPASTTDSILAVIGEELGLIATWAVLVLFACLVWQGMRIAGKSPDRFSGLIAAGVSCLLGMQALLNIAVVTGSIPATGVTLPFVSYGGSSLLFSLIGAGLLLNVSRGCEAPAGSAGVSPEFQEFR